MTSTTATASDGFTRASTGPGARARAASLRWWWIPVGLLVVLVIAIVTIKPSEDFSALSIRNYQDEGARAVAEVAQDRGVEIRQIKEAKDARIADPQHTTVIVAYGDRVQSVQVESILGYPGDVIILSPSWDVLDAVAPSLSLSGGAAGVMEAACSDPDATAAGTIATLGGVFVGALPDGAVGCFSPQTGGFAMVTIPREGRTITLIADPSLFTNDLIADEGNAALGLRLVGAKESAVWYLNTNYEVSSLTWLDSSDGEAPDPSPSPEFFPPGTGTAVLALFLALIAVALWRGRRFGPLVSEPLPVVIRSSEATAGRARLYRAAGAHGRAAASLRAAAATRMGKRLGVPRTADKEFLVNAIVRATGRPAAEIDSALYGAPPRNESAMMDLVAHIDTIENEVHRP